MASLVASFFWFGWLGSFLAVIFGHVALGQINRSGGRQQGAGLAITGLVLGYLELAALLLVRWPRAAFDDAPARVADSLRTAEPNRYSHVFEP